MVARFWNGLILALAVLAAACAAQSPVGPSDVTIIDNVSLLDGRGGQPVPNARIVVRERQIVSVEASSAPLPAGANVIDGQGKYLLPGFIDMHAHLLFPRCDTADNRPVFDRPLSERALARQLEFGITTVRSPATPTIEGLHLRDDLNAGKVKGPRAHASAELINDARLSDEQLRQIVRDAMPRKPDYFKVYARLKPPQVATVIDEAHRHNVPVIGHLQQTSWAEGVRLGIDHLAHSLDWSIDSLPSGRRAAYIEATKARRGFRARIDWLEAFDPDDADQQALIKALAEHRVSVDVTLMAYDGKFSPPESSRYRRDPFLNAFPELRRDWESCSNATSDWTAEDFRRWQSARTKLFAWIKRMSDDGVLLVTGTDLTNEWIIPGVGLHHEFELLAEAGLSPAQILRMTGADAAEALRRNDVGIIEAGRRADLVLLSENPLQKISNTRSIMWVMQGGEIVVRGPPRP